MSAEVEKLLADALQLPAQARAALAAQRFPGPERMLPIHETLPLEEGSSDLTFAACVFHHIEPNAHRLWLRELLRVTSGDGVFVLFEHNPYNPLTRTYRLAADTSINYIVTFRRDA